MRLDVLFHDITFVSSQGTMDKEITAIEFDSRKIVKDSLFVAIRGTVTDGHNFIDKAIEKGCSVIVCEELPKQIKTTITYICVKNCAITLGEIGAVWYGFPSKKIKLVGVTGTNGKTTIATTLYNLFRKLGYKVGLISTICNYVESTPYPTAQTTPDSLTIQALLAEMVAVGCEFAFMEVSSHAIDQNRIAGIDFVGGIYTNLSRDHMDYHKTFSDYLNVKKRFFDELPSAAFALTNMDDKNGTVMLQNTEAQKKSYSLLTLADYKGKILEEYMDGMLLDINNQEVTVRFIGRFNASNLLAVYGTALLLDQASSEVLVAMSQLSPAPGRFETIFSPKGVTAIVDYAHTPDALINVLDTIQELQDGRGGVITVVGCGGNRDKGKRPIMAKEAAKRSTQLVLTTDNPRYENPQAILEDMLEGLTVEQKDETLVIVDRKQAILTATKVARQGDVILIAGKGHEDYQDVEGVKHPFDDKKIIMEIWKK